MIFPSGKIITVHSCHIFKVILVVLLFHSACKDDTHKTELYYYSQEKLETEEPDSSQLININDEKVVRSFLQNQVFVSKADRLIINDSLVVTRFINGKKVAVMICEITEYLVHNDRLLLLTDTTTQKLTRCTISQNGIITDMQTYSLYERKN